MASVSQNPPLHEQAPAKLNLYLHIVGRDQRGYHLLDSLVAFADIADTLVVTPADSLSLSIDGPFAIGLETDNRNLVWCAAERLGEATGNAPHFAIRLTKTLPVASGIGGGSADAAACLRALARAWGIPPTGDVVMRIAAELGADVPVCVPCQPCFMGGVGERLDPCPALPAAAIVLVNPGFPLATKDVFAARQGPFAPEGRFDVKPDSVTELAQILSHRINGLTAAALSLRPELGRVLDLLERQSACLLTRMLGSGATCLGLFADAVAADAAAAAITLAQPGWWVMPGRLA